MDVKILQSYYKAFNDILESIYKGDDKEQVREFVKRYLLEDYFMNTETYERSKPTSKTIEELVTKVKAKITYDYFNGDLEGEKNIDEIMAMLLGNNDTSKEEIHIRSLEAEPAKEKEKLPKVKATRPPKQIVTVDKVSNKIFCKDLVEYIENDCVSVNMNVAKRGKKEINTLVSINYSELKKLNITGVQRLTLFDRAVLDAINTIYKAGNKYMTIDQIFRVISGKENGRVRPIMKEKINKSIQKMMVVLVTINNNEEVEAYNTSKIKVTENILKATYVEFENSGNKVEGIKVDNSIILQYAETRNQIDSSMPIEIMDTPINKNETNIAIQSYLYRRVLAIKKGGNMSNKILLNTLLEDLEIIDTSKKLTSTQRDKRKKIIETITSIFDYWKEKGFIDSYKIEGKRPVKGFTIFYPGKVIKAK